MSEEALVAEVELLLSPLKGGRLANLGVLPWAAPVVAFGNPAASRVATLGLNPSNLEFVGPEGTQLYGAEKRFESLQSLKLDNWGEATREDIRRIWHSCEEYFFRNPYDRWFKRLDRLLMKTGVSYYNRIGERACHLDLVPFATAEKWSALSRDQRTQLVQLGVPSLTRTLSASDVEVLVLNGATVVREFGQLLSGEGLHAQIQPTWSLQDGRVQGISYEGRVSAVGGIALRRELLVLGFNHNIQSSFGVTSQAVANIATWIDHHAKGALA